MLRTRLAAFGVFMVLAAGRYALGYPAPPPDAGQLQGTWQVVSVERDGQADAGQVGSLVTFAGDGATFQPRSLWLGDGSLATVRLAQLDRAVIERAAFY